MSPLLCSSPHRRTLLPQLRTTLSLRQMNMLHRGLMQLKMNCSVMLLQQLEMVQKLRTGITGTQENMGATTADTQEQKMHRGLLLPRRACRHRTASLLQYRHRHRNGNKYRHL